MDSSLDQSIFDTFNSSAISEMDDQKLIQELRDTIEVLEIENQNLKANQESQVNFAVISAKVSEENNKLVVENRQLSTQISELNQRLNICFQENKELKLQLENERKAQAENNYNWREEVEKSKLEQKNQMYNMTQKLAELTEQKEKLMIDIKTEKNYVEKIIAASGRYFEKKFASPEEVLAFFSNPQNSIQKPKIPTQDPPKTIYVDNPKIKELKEQIAQLKQVNIDLKRTIDKQNQEKRANERDSHQNQIVLQEEYERKILNLKTQFDSEKAALEAQANSLKTTISDLKKELSKPIPQPEQKIVVKTVVDQSAVDELNEKLKKLKEDALVEAMSYDSRISSLKESNDELTEKLSSQSNELIQIQSQLSKAKLELQNDQIIISELKSANNSLRAVIHNKEPQKQAESDKKQKQKQIDSEYQKFVKSFDDLKLRYQNLQAQESEHIAECETLRRKVYLLESELDKANNLASTTALDLQDCRSQLKKRKEITQEDILPSSILIPQCFDFVLSAKIERIAKNPSLQAASKLQTIYQIISDHIKAINEKNEAETHELNSEFEQLRSNVNSFLVDVSVTLLDKALNFDSIRGGDLSEIIKEINRLRNENETFSYQIQNLQSALGELGDLVDVGCESPEMIKESFARIREERKRREEKLKKYKDENEELKTDIKEAAEEYESAIADLQAQLDDTLIELANSKRSQDSMKADYERLNIENDKRKAEFEKIATDFNSLKNDFDSEVAKKVNQMRELAQSEINVMNSKLDELNEEFTKLTNNSEEKDKIIKGLRQSVLSAQNEANKLREDLDKSEKNFNLKMKAKEAAFVQEKADMKVIHENTISNLSEQCVSQRQDIERMSLDIADKQAKIIKMEQALSVLRSESRKSDRILRLQVEKLERDIRYIEVEKRHKIMEIENECNAKLESQKKESEEKERELFVYTLSKFRQFFNPLEQLNERTYRAVIDAAKEELDRLEKSDNEIRQMLSCSDKQTTKDAVARLTIEY